MGAAINKTDTMNILDLDDLRRDMLEKADEMRCEAMRLDECKPEDAENLRRIAERLEEYMRDYLDI
jgi:hypothetical protein